MQDTLGVRLDTEGDFSIDLDNWKIPPGVGVTEKSR